MEPLSIALFSLFILTGGVLGWQIFVARETLQAVVDRTMVLSESQGAHAKQTTEIVSALQENAQPRIKALFLPSRNSRFPQLASH